jgi:hypothetical protein
MARASNSPRRSARPRQASNFSKSTLDFLRDHVGNMCSLCDRPTSGPSREPGKRTNVGSGAHITAAAPGGPRYDKTLTSAQRRHHENGIWCCRDCGKLVDDDASTYTAARLRKFKAAAIDRALHRVTVGRAARNPDKSPARDDLRLRWEEELDRMAVFTRRARKHAILARRLDGWDTPFWVARHGDLKKHFGHCEWWVDAVDLYKRWGVARRSFPTVSQYLRPTLSTGLRLTDAGEKLGDAEEALAKVRTCVRVEAELESITERDRDDAALICEAAAKSSHGAYVDFAERLGLARDGIGTRLAVAAWNYSCDAEPDEQDQKAAELLRTGWLPTAEVMMIEGAGASPAYDRLRRLKLGPQRPRR